MKLDVPIVLQTEKSLDCGLACASMLLKYYSIEKSIDELKEEIKIFENIGTYVPQVGEYLIKQGFDVEIVTLNPHLFTSKFKDKSQDEILIFLKEAQKNPKKESFKEPLNFFIRFIEAGGKIKIKIPDIEDIKEEISQGRPLGALITSNFLLFDKPIFNFHFNIINGFDNKSVYVNDPMWDYRGGNQKYPINDFLYGLYASAYGDLDNASLMKVKKR